MWYSYYITCNSGATAIAFKLGGRAITLPVHTCSQGGQTTCITLKHLHQGGRGITLLTRTPGFNYYITYM